MPRSLVVVILLGAVFSIRAKSQTIDPSSLPQEVKDAYKQLTPEQKKEVQKSLDQLTPEQKQQASDGLARMTQGDRRKLLDEARHELSSDHGLTTFHYIDGPRIPPSLNLGISDLFGRVRSTGLTPTDAKLLVAAKGLLPSVVMILRRRADSSSDQGVGSGILISPHLLLTARHVADKIDANPSEFLLLQVCTPQDHFLNPLRFDQQADLPSDGFGDPDLALLRVGNAYHARKLKVGGSMAQKMNEIASLGAAEMERLPSMGTGIVTTQVAPRGIDGARSGQKRTVFGTTVRSFPGLSGSPVFDANGQIVGVLIEGVKEYASTGDRVTHVGPGVDWEQFQDWTWATPLQPFMSAIDRVVEAEAN